MELILFGNFDESDVKPRINLNAKSGIFFIMYFKRLFKRIKLR